MKGPDWPEVVAETLSSALRGGCSSHAKEPGGCRLGGMSFFLTQSLADATNHRMKGNVVWKPKLPGLPARESGPLCPEAAPAGALPWTSSSRVSLQAQEPDAALTLHPASAFPRWALENRFPSELQCPHLRDVRVRLT